jgi:hypothetical protein
MANETWLEAIGGVEDALEQEFQENLAKEAALFEEPIREFTTNRHQVLELAKSSVDFLAGMAMPTVFQFGFPPVLIAAWALLCECVVKKRDFSQIALGIPRGHGKTTLIKLFVLYCILFTDKKFILIMSSTATHAENIIADIFKFLEERNIKGTFGDWKLGRETDRTDLKKFSFCGRSIIVAGIGAGGSVRGLNLNNERPDVMIFEDIQTKECAESQVQSKTLKEWMVGTAQKAKSPHGCLTIFCGNMFPGSNSLLKQLKTNRRWIKFIAGAILEDGTALWPALRPLEDLIAELDNDIAAGCPEIFFAEVLNDTDAAVSSRVDFALIKQWPYDQFEIPQGKFIIIDPAPGGDGGDDVSIGYFGVYDGKPACMELACGSFSPGNTILTTLKLALKTGTRTIICEAQGYQASLLYWFEQTCKEYNLVGFNFEAIYSGSRSKNARISEMLKELTASEILLHTNVRAEVTHQIANWNPLKKKNTDGILDLLTYAPRVIAEFPHLIITEDTTLYSDAHSAEVIENNHCF